MRNFIDFKRPIETVYGNEAKFIGEVNKQHNGEPITDEYRYQIELFDAYSVQPRVIRYVNVLGQIATPNGKRHKVRQIIRNVEPKVEAAPSAAPAPKADDLPPIYPMTLLKHDLAATRAEVTQLKQMFATFASSAARSFARMDRAFTDLGLPAAADEEKRT